MSSSNREDVINVDAYVDGEGRSGLERDAAPTTMGLRPAFARAETEGPRVAVDETTAQICDDALWRLERMRASMTQMQRMVEESVQAIEASHAVLGREVPLTAADS